MGLKADFLEVTTVWKQSSWRVKAFLALSAFLASGSIASLSETVFRWKGYVRDALSFYQACVSDQLLHLLQFIFPTFHIAAGVPHFLILSSLYLGANVRVAAFAKPAARSRAIALRASANYIGVATAMLFGIAYSSRQLDAESALGLFLGSAFAASLSFWFVGGAARILWFANLLGPFIVVSLIAAVASGFARTT